MIRITKQTDYALVLLGALCNRQEGDRFSARQLAEQTSLPEPMVGKILKILHRGGILDSKRGSAGGYSIARNPEQISVCQVVEALEGPIAIVECNCQDGSCGYSALCPIRDNVRVLNESIRMAFESISVQALSTKLPDAFQQEFMENITNRLRAV